MQVAGLAFKRSDNRMIIVDTQPDPNEPTDPTKRNPNEPPDPTKQNPIEPPATPAAPPEELPGPKTYPIHPDIPEQPIHEPTPERTIA